MSFGILCAPGSDPGDARARATAVVAVDGPADVAAAAARVADPYLLVLGPGARALPRAFGGLTAALGAGPGVLGGVAAAGGMRRYGFMLAPAPLGPLPFEVVPIDVPASEAGADAVLRGPIDVVAPGMVLARRELLLEPLPAEPVAAMLELCARARAAGLEVVCRPGFACEVPGSADDRGRVAALRAVAERRPELTGAFRLPAGLRDRAVEREVRLSAGRYVRARVQRPALTVVRDADALRAQMRVRGDRYVLVTTASGAPDDGVVDRLAGALEEAPFVAIAAPDVAALDGGCVLIAVGRFPYHVEATGATLPEALRTLRIAAAGLRLAVRAPGYLAPPAPAPRRRTATAVFLASSLPEITRMSLDAVMSGLRADDAAVAVVAEGAETLRRLLAAHPQVRVELDPADPLMSAALNRALGAASTDLVVLVADDLLLAAGAFDRVRAAFDRVPTLGAAFAAVPGAAGGEGVLDATYADLAHMRTVAEERARNRAGELEPIEAGTSPVVALSREALAVVGGIDPALGPTRRGIADLTARLRAAGYGIVRCDDALAHRFDAAASHNPAAAADAGQPLPAPPDPVRIARGFNPNARVPFGDAARAATVAPAGEPTHAVAIPVADPAELERAAAVVGAAAAAYDAAAPIRLHVLLDGTVSAAAAAARLRPVLSARGIPLESTIAVRVERAGDMAAWRTHLETAVTLVVAAGHERPPLAGLPAVSANALGSLLGAVTR